VTGKKKEVDGLVKVTRVTVPSGEEADEAAREFNTRKRSKARENLADENETLRVPSIFENLVGECL